MSPHRQHFDNCCSFLALAALLTLGSCDALGLSPDGCLIEASGRVVLAETGESIEGLGVSLQSVDIIGAVVDADRTDAEGRFFLSYNTTRPRGSAATTTCYSLTVNDEPYDSRYTTNGGSICEATECSVDFGTIELEENESP